MLLVIWFFLWALLWAVYMSLDGFDFGIGMLLPFVARNDQEKRILYSATTPFWDGNEVWLITAGGVTFAAFPTAYAVMFSALYAPLFILLFALIFRAAALEFRNQLPNPGWRKRWDAVLFICGLVPALILGVFFSNLFLGIPIDQNGVYHGNLLRLLNPYALVGGVFFISLFCLHGALWLGVKSSGPFHARMAVLAGTLWTVTLLLALVYLVLTWVYTDFFSKAYAYIPLVVALAAMFFVRYFLRAGRSTAAFISNMAVIIGLAFFGFAGLFPSLVPSNLSPAYDLTIHNAASSPLTLKIMFGVVICAVPIIIAYQIWAYHILGKKITEKDMQQTAGY